MNNYPYSPDLLNELTNLRNDFINEVKLAVQEHININDVDILDEDFNFLSDEYENNVLSTSIIHNDFLLTEVIIGQSKL